jgi:hypothetical protein
MSPVYESDWIAKNTETDRFIYLIIIIYLFKNKKMKKWLYLTKIGTRSPRNPIRFPRTLHIKEIEDR